jgi:hypothetical protein
MGKFGHYICCAQGELGSELSPEPNYDIARIQSQKKGVSDIVECKTEDTIVFPHIDSCMGVILRLQSAEQIIGIHLNMFGSYTHEDITPGTGERKEYYHQAGDFYITQTHKYIGNIKCGVFFDPSGNWEDVAKIWCKCLNMANNRYLGPKGPKGINSSDVWTHDDTIWHRPYNRDQSPAAYLPVIPVGQCKRISILMINGKDLK